MDSPEIQDIKKEIEEVKNIKLVCSHQAVYLRDRHLVVPCLNLSVPFVDPDGFVKVNSAETGRDYIFVSCTTR